MSALTLGEIAARLGLELRGDAAIEITGVATLAGAQTGQLGFLANPKYRSEVLTTRASAVVLHPNEVAHCNTNALLARNPYAAYAKIAALFDDNAQMIEGFVHPTAVIEAGAQVHASAHIGAQCVIDARAIVEHHAVLGPGCVIGPDCVVGAHSRLVARVTLVKRVRLGNRVLIHPGAVLGADGFGLAFDTDHWIKVPQLGGVQIGDDCEIGANTTIDCGAIEDTVLGQDVRLDNQIQVGHNVRIGDHTAIAGCTAIAGSARIGANCLIAGGVGIVGHIEIADRVTVQAMSLVTHNLSGPAEYAGASPLMPSRDWRKAAVRLRQLDRLARKINSVSEDASDE